MKLHCFSTGVEVGRIPPRLPGSQGGVYGLFCVPFAFFLTSGVSSRLDSTTASVKLALQATPPCGERSARRVRPSSVDGAFRVAGERFAEAPWAPQKHAETKEQWMHIHGKSTVNLSLSLSSPTIRTLRAPQKCSAAQC